MRIIRNHEIILNVDLPKGEVIARDLDLVFFDTERTGLELGREITEIGYVKARAKTFEIITEGDIKIKPQFIEAADPEALRIFGYDSEEWKREGVDLKTGLQKFLSVTEECMLVGHNLPSDWMHLEKALMDCGLKPNYYYKGLDTVTLGWLKLRHELKGISLREMAEHFGIDQGQAHRAIDDARTTYQVFLKLVR